MDGIFALPGRGLHLLKAAAHDDLHILTTQTSRRTAAVHSRVATTQNNHARSYCGDVAKRYGCQPVNTHMDMGGGFLASGNIQFTTTWRTATDKNGIKALSHQVLKRIDPLPTAEINPHVEDVTRLFINN